MTPGPQSSPHLTLRKEDKLKNKSDFDFVKEKGRRFSDSFFTLLAVPGHEPELTGVRFGVICSRKFHKNAVVRNRARRIISESFRLLKPRMKSCRVIVIPRRAICTAKMPEVRLKIEKALTTTRCLTPSPDSVSPLPPQGSC